MPVLDIASLRRFPLFDRASDDALAALIATGVERSFAAGEVILAEGSAGREMYLIVEGSVEVFKHQDEGQVLLATRGPGELVGEMALIDAGHRSATVRAREPVGGLEFSDADLWSIWAKHPGLLLQMVQILTSRLREADHHLIADLTRKNEELARAYAELQQAQAAIVEVERLERELELARQLQESILPREFPHLKGFTCAARSRPARQVGGDFYDIIPLAGSRVALVIADVSDKGMAAAIFMALSRSLIRAEARRSPSPRQVLLRTHQLLLEISKANIFLTAFYAVLDLERRTLTYARGGHDRPLLVIPESRECRWLDAQGTLLGFVREVTLEEACVEVGPGNVLVLYTDGVTEANSPDGRFFGEDRLREVVCEAGHLAAQELCDAIFRSVEEFEGGGPHFDDMAVLVLKAEVPPSA